MVTSNWSISSYMPFKPISHGCEQCALLKVKVVAGIDAVRCQEWCLNFAVPSSRPMNLESADEFPRGLLVYLLGQSWKWLCKWSSTANSVGFARFCKATPTRCGLTRETNTFEMLAKLVIENIISALQQLCLLVVTDGSTERMSLGSHWLLRRFHRRRVLEIIDLRFRKRLPWVSEDEFQRWGQE